MPRGRHRQVSTATRISLLAAICAPALVAVVLAVAAGGATTLRIAVLLGVLSAAGAITWVVRGTTAHHRRAAEESVARRRERERTTDELRAVNERSGEHGIVLDAAATHPVSAARPPTADPLARGAAVPDRRGGEARPAAPAVGPEVRRPPVSSPDLVPAYAASMFGPAEREQEQDREGKQGQERKQGQQRAARPPRPAEPVRVGAPPATDTPAPRAPANEPVGAEDRAAAPIAPPVELKRFDRRTTDTASRSTVEVAEIAEVADVTEPEQAAEAVPAPVRAEAPAANSAAGTAEVTRMVRDKVLEVTRRVADTGATGAFDFFGTRGRPAEPEETGFLTDELFGPEARYDALVAGRPHGEDREAVEAPAAVDTEFDDIEADRIVDPVRPEAPAAPPTPAAAPERRGHGVRFAPAGFEPARPVRQAKPLPVDLTAHDDTEEIPRIDVRKHA